MDYSTGLLRGEPFDGEWLSPKWGAGEASVLRAEWAASLDACGVRRERKSRNEIITHPLRVGHGFTSRTKVKEAGDARSRSLASAAGSSAQVWILTNCPIAVTDWRRLPRNSVFPGVWTIIDCLREKPNLTLLFPSTLKRLWVRL